MASSSVPQCTGIACKTNVVAVSMAYMICLRMYLRSNKEHLMAYYLQHNTDAGSAGTVHAKGYLSRWQMPFMLGTQSITNSHTQHGCGVPCSKFDSCIQCMQKEGDLQQRRGTCLSMWLEPRAEPLSPPPYPPPIYTVPTQTCKTSINGDMRS